MPLNENLTSPENGIVHLARSAARRAFILASGCAWVLMGGLFLAGFIMIGGALWTFAFGLRGGNPINELAKDAVTKVLGGLEFMFLAPMPPFVFLSLARFARGIYTDKSDSAESEATVQWATHRLHRVKALIVGLMTAALATDLLDRAFKGSDARMVLTEAALLMAFGLVWLGLERMCHHSDSAQMATRHE